MKKTTIKTITFALLGALALGGTWQFLQQTNYSASSELDSTVSFAKTENKEEHLNPGYYAQWFDEKKNKDGIIPYGLEARWQAEIDLMMAQKTTSASIIAATTELGPFNVGGRTSDIHVDYANNNRVFAGAAGGGLWRSDDNGSHFAPVNDRQASLSVSTITQSPFATNEIYYGTGNGYGAPGGGVFKSVDGGLSFQVLSSTLSFPAMNRILKLEHARDSNQSQTLYLGTKGGKAFRTTDGGASWQLIYTNPKRVRDIVAFPDGSVILSLQGGNGLVRSLDGSPNSFSDITSQSGLVYPVNGYSRIEIENCFFAAPHVVYALIEGEDKNDGIVALFRSTNSGLTWASTGGVPSAGTAQGSFCMVLGVSATNPLRVMAGAKYPRISMDGGLTWGKVANTHSDYHGFAADTTTRDSFYVSNDGGMAKIRWQPSSNPIPARGLDKGYSVTQFYGGDFAPQGDIAVAGAQDNGTRKVSPGLEKKVGKNDGGYAYVHKQTPNIAYRSWQGLDNGNDGPIIRYGNFLGTNPNDGYRINTDQVMNDEKYDFINFYTMNNADGEQLYCRTNDALWRTVDAGSNWDRMTNGNKSWMKAIGLSVEANPVLFLGGKNGNLIRFDNAASASQGSGVSLSASVPISDNISNIAVHPYDNNVVFVTFGDYNQNPRVYRVDNALTNSPVWTSISGDLPVELPANDIQLHPDAPDEIMFVGTDWGLFYTMDGGISWSPELSIPNVNVKELKLRESDLSLFVITYGRGIWKLGLEGCTPLASYPYTESFETQGMSGWHDVTGDNFDWTSTNSATPTTGTGPNQAFDGNRYMFTETNGHTGGQEANFVSNCFDIQSLNSPQMSWRYHMKGSHIGTLSLDVSTNSGLTWLDDVWTRTGAQGTTWQTETLDLTVIPTSARHHVVFRFRVVTDAATGNKGDIALDLVQINDASPRLVSSVLTEDLVDLDQPAVYPNPAIGTAQVKLPEAWKGTTLLNLTDMSGRLVRDMEIPAGQSIVALNLVDVKAGLYLVKLRGEKQSKTLRLLVQ